MTPALNVLLVCVITAFAVLTVVVKDLLYAMLFFALMSISIGGFYFVLKAPYVAVFQLLIYAGAVVVLLLVTVMLTTKKEAQEEIR